MKPPVTVTMSTTTRIINEVEVPVSKIHIHYEDSPLQNFGGMVYIKSPLPSGKSRRVVFPAFRIVNGWIEGEEGDSTSPNPAPIQAVIDERLTAVHEAVVQSGFDDFPGGTKEGWHMAEFHFTTAKTESWSLAALREPFSLERMILLDVPLSAYSVVEA